MPTVLGVDGCPHGWCAVSLDTTTNALVPRHYDTFSEVIKAKARIIAIDVPIGLMEGPGGRDCDREARTFLRWPRASSVFSPPLRQTLKLCGASGNHAKATARNKRLSGKGISIQAFGIAPKILEVDEAMTRAFERRAHEAHPEVSFAVLSGHPMKHRKSRTDGRAERWQALRKVFPQLPDAPEKPGILRGLCDLEDYVDALVCAWTARRILERKCESLPAKPPRDQLDLQMAIWRPLA